MNARLLIAAVLLAVTVPARALKIGSEDAQVRKGDYTVEKGQPHRMDTLAGVYAARLFDGFEETRKGCSQ